MGKMVAKASCTWWLGGASHHVIVYSNKGHHGQSVLADTLPLVAFIRVDIHMVAGGGQPPCAGCLGNHLAHGG